MNRREFLTGAAALAAVSGCRCPLCGEKRKLVAAQLWNLNKVFWDDPAKYLTALKAAGFDGVEFAGFGKAGAKPPTAKEIRRLLADAGLRGAGSHMTGKVNFTGDGLERNLDFCAEAGIESFTCAHYGAPDRAGWDDFIAFISAAADEGAARGIPVSFHNHFSEFEQKFGSETVWDYVFRRASKNLCQQVDTSQAIKCGIDPVELLERYSGRNWCVHIKENYPMAKRPNDPTTPVNLKAVADYCKADPCLRWFILEDEREPTGLGATIALAKKFLPLV